MGDGRVSGHREQVQDVEPLLNAEHFNDAPRMASGDILPPSLRKFPDLIFQSSKHAKGHCRLRIKGLNICQNIIEPPTSFPLCGTHGAAPFGKLLPNDSFQSHFSSSASYLA